MKLLTQASEEVDWKGKKRPAPKFRITPLLFYHWKIISTTSLRKLQREVIIQKWGGDERPCEARCNVRAGWGQGRSFLGHLTRVLFLKFPFPQLFVDPNCSMPMRCSPGLPLAGQLRVGGGVGAPSNCLCPAFPQVSRAGGRPIPICFRTILIEDSSAQLTTYV